LIVRSPDLGKDTKSKERKRSREREFKGEKETHDVESIVADESTKAEKRRHQRKKEDDAIHKHKDPESGKLSNVCDLL